MGVSNNSAICTELDCDYELKARCSKSVGVIREHALMSLNVLNKSTANTDMTNVLLRRSG